MVLISRENDERETLREGLGENVTISYVGQDQIVRNALWREVVKNHITLWTSSVSCGFEYKAQNNEFLKCVATVTSRSWLYLSSKLYKPLLMINVSIVMKMSKIEDLFIEKDQRKKFKLWMDTIKTNEMRCSPRHGERSTSSSGQEAMYSRLQLKRKKKT